MIEEEKANANLHPLRVGLGILANFIIDSTYAGYRIHQRGAQCQGPGDIQAVHVCAQLYVTLCDLMNK